jgi:hypothetical protein
MIGNPLELGKGITLVTESTTIGLIKGGVVLGGYGGLNRLMSHLETLPSKIRPYIGRALDFTAEGFVEGFLGGNLPGEWFVGVWVWPFLCLDVIVDLCFTRFT